ncbi:MAG: hypothetical protein FWF92_10300 [Oscillospiraceae bacterium]|nr:hypothetical protein [Oscillospiraceae bacterium]
MLKFKNIICVILITCALIFMFSCAKEESNPANVNNGENNTESGGNAAEANNPDTAISEQQDKLSKWVREPINLPEIDFNGRDFNVITVEVTEAIRFYEHFDADEQNGEPINDALYTRKLHVEEKFNINMKTVKSANPAETARKSILAGDNNFDLIVDTLFNIRNLASQSILADLYNVPYIKDDLDKPWWDQALKRDLSIKGKLFFQAGDIVLKDKLRLAVMYFNKDMFKTVGLEYPYQYVYDGVWTIDKLVEITKGVNADLNGDGIMDQNDQWGLMSEWENGLHMFIAAGERTVKLDGNGFPEITMNTPRGIEVIQKVLDLCTDGVTMFHADTIKDSGNIWYKASEFFQENRFLMRTSVFEPIVRDLRAMPTDFGILPYAKYDEQQENYYSNVKGDGLFIAIPDNADHDFSGLITEALAYESSTTLMPAFYDLCLTSKILRDDESEGMLDIIFDSKVYDIGNIYNIGTFPTILYNLISSKKSDFISQFEKNLGANEKALDKFITNYDIE